MNDPRVTRTHTHVLETARRMLAEPAAPPLTLSSLAAEARVSRRTLYTHWGSIEKVISEAITQVHHGEHVGREELPIRERLEIFLVGVRDGIHERVTRAALAALMMQSSYERSDASASLMEMTSGRLDDFSNFVGPVTREEYMVLVGPLFLSEFFFAEPASDEVLAELVGHGERMFSA